MSLGSAGGGAGVACDSSTHSWGPGLYDGGVVNVLGPARKKEGAGHPVSGVVPFCVGWRPVVHGTPTLTEWPMPFFVFPDSGVVPFCVGWRPVAYGTPTLTEWSAPSFFVSPVSLPVHV